MLDRNKILEELHYIMKDYRDMNVAGGTWYDIEDVYKEIEELQQNIKDGKYSV